MVTVGGVAAVDRNALLRFMIHQFAEDLRDVQGKYIFYIDYTDDEVLNERLEGCFRYMNRMDANNVFTYSGGFMNWIADIVKEG